MANNNNMNKKNSQILLDWLLCHTIWFVYMESISNEGFISLNNAVTGMSLGTGYC